LYICKRHAVLPYARTRARCSAPFPICSLLLRRLLSSFFFFNDTAPTEIYTLSLHDALPISHLRVAVSRRRTRRAPAAARPSTTRSEEHTSELQSRFDLVCRLLLEKKKKKKYEQHNHANTQTHDTTSDRTADVIDDSDTFVVL